MTVNVPPLPGAEDAHSERGARQRRDAAAAWWRDYGDRMQKETAERLGSVTDA